MTEPKQPLVIGFTGHRDKRARPEQLAQIHRQYPDAIWIHGGAPGFDTQVEEFPRQGLTRPNITLRPDYKRYEPRVAPLRRNEDIVHLSGLIVALYDGRETGGTAFTVRYARSIGVPVIVLEPEEEGK
jgi:hypothetical protein